MNDTTGLDTAVEPVSNEPDTGADVQQDGCPGGLPPAPSNPPDLTCGRQMATYKDNHRTYQERTRRRLARMKATCWAFSL